ncbi:MAG: hypothetical protein A3J07_03220 [Candidatus Doudnabacteria bacterium RIFCSPLOWO2_02_FULL_49_13]|uniref:D-alanyl-D-alanine dipeptidase n=1 Tax=Candidatus Doudnabacteria bacterium RIFCSPHIGHO2_12_FULL_48_16 TaxID=1817838 RepID=A0A1F5PII5_9BACT|nr:MAG: hypothetical protein A3B77_02025 [Candidatus Doudnabacteria bacterium RIFCSPHIGHO2_02_FULL_49_24]OGE89020.1 MAG: hypothetical protein A2760_00145 [Candidatus Doudnabacteria bacterium RIFCSPHIGHO2_01_FULL_50_67]OGE89689.1 MAG: hypothetical protein A3E29_00530 [Candidatus Doudnabacteria bacterium RIFCSPHIGHO2_12_FULL_48_16]OGE97523.1 MAG: hypothetical protein A2990_02270 [Candidatus Doudnabacteria bacterium RIFCSPLOWO2_01_FULL_49_40]OGF03073.1 MAG: hypothetical protein A3J07_03220 [Candid
MKKLYKINDSEVLAIPIKENHEVLVDIKQYPVLFYDESREGVFKYNQPICKLRKGVMERLLVAQEDLPRGIVLKIKEGFRPLAVQKKIFKEHLGYLTKKYPKKSQAFLKAKAVEYVAPPDIVPPHTTGGAVDLTLMTLGGKELNMGRKINGTSSDSVTYAKRISNDAKKNRKILIKAMTEAGFVNYPYEWWHWSYGDRYWVFIKKKKYSIYNSR